MPGTARVKRVTGVSPVVYLSWSLCRGGPLFETQLFPPELAQSPLVSVHTHYGVASVELPELGWKSVATSRQRNQGAYCPGGFAPKAPYSTVSSFAHLGYLDMLCRCSEVAVPRSSAYSFENFDLRLFYVRISPTPRHPCNHLLVVSASRCRLKLFQEACTETFRPR